jgi:hypothetical protein
MASALRVQDLRELSEAWAFSLRAGGRRTRETLRVYLRNVRKFLTFCEGRDLEPLTRRTLEAFVADLLERGREAARA